MSKIFEPHRVIGLVAKNKPCVLQTRGSQHFVTTCIGKSFNTYGCKKLNLLFVSPLHDSEITCLAGHKDYIISAADKTMYCWKRGKLLRTYEGHDSEVIHILPFGDHIISFGSDKKMLIHDIETGELYNETWLPHHVTAVLHPATYLNKILIGTEEGLLQLWNVRTVKMIHQFEKIDSEITVLAQSTGVDIVAIGLKNGKIHLHNLKFDETLMTFYQDWGCVTSLSFRTDGTPHLVSGSLEGHLAVWDLEKHQLHSTLHNAHQSTVTSASYFTSQPLMFTASPDNSVKIWVFDDAGGTGRLLKERSGHRAPPTTVQFYGSTAESVLSAGHDRSVRLFSVIKDERSRELSQGSLASKSKKIDVKIDELKLTPVIALAAEEIREREWSNVITAHSNSREVRMWNTVSAALESKPLLPKLEKLVVSAVTITVCGNIGVVGYNSGHLTAFNLQSGVNRGLYGKITGHRGKITGIATDSVNKHVISCGADTFIKVWDLSSRTKVKELQLDAPIQKCIFHRDSNLLAVAMSHNLVNIVDIDTMKIVRSFKHSSTITDMCYSLDCRWLAVATLDGIIRIWDVVTARLIDCFITDDAVTSLSFSKEYLVTSHLNNLGIHIWNNKTLYESVLLKPLPDDTEPRPVQMFSNDTSQIMEIDEDDSTEGEWISLDQINENLITLSSSSKTRWTTLCNLDIIKKRNKPKQPPKAPKEAPFFLRTTKELVPKFILEEKVEDGEKDKMSKVGGGESEFQKLLASGKSTIDFLKYMETLSPSTLDVELQSLAPEDGGSPELVQSFINFIKSALETRGHFDMVQAYLNVFLKYNRKYLMETPELQDNLSDLKSLQSETWRTIQQKIQECLCVTQFIKNATL